MIGASYSALCISMHSKFPLSITSPAPLTPLALYVHHRSPRRRWPELASRTTPCAQPPFPTFAWEWHSLLDPASGDTLYAPPTDQWDPPPRPFVFSGLPPLDLAAGGPGGIGLQGYDFKAPFACKGHGTSSRRTFQMLPPPPSFHSTTPIIVPGPAGLPAPPPPSLWPYPWLGPTYAAGAGFLGAPLGGPQGAPGGGGSAGPEIAGEPAGAPYGGRGPAAARQAAKRRRSKGGAAPSRDPAAEPGPKVEECIDLTGE